MSKKNHTTAKLFQCMSRGVDHENHLSFTAGFTVAFWHLFINMYVV